MHIKEMKSDEKQKKKKDQPLSLFSAIIAGASDMFSLFESDRDWQERRQERLDKLYKELDVIHAEREKIDLDNLPDFRKRKKLGPRAEKFDALGIESGPEQDLISLRGDFDRAVLKFKKEYIS